MENQTDEILSEADRKAAWEEFENEKKGLNVNIDPGMLNQAANNSASALLSKINPQQIQEMYRQQNPHLSHEQIVQATRTYIMQLQSAITKKPAYNNDYYKQQMAQAKSQESSMYPQVYNKGANAAAAAARMINQRAMQQMYRQQQQVAQLQQARQTQLLLAQAAHQRQTQHQLRQQLQRNQRRQQQQQQQQDDSDIEEIVLDGEAETGPN